MPRMGPDSIVSIALVFAMPATPPLMWLTRNAPVYSEVTRSSSSALNNVAASAPCV